MRFVTFRHGTQARAGVLLGDGTRADDQVVDLAHQAMRPALAGAEPQVIEFLRLGLDGIAAAIRDYGDDAKARISLGGVRLLAPLPRPPRIFAFAHNYKDALAERNMPPPSEPVLFMKHGETVIGPAEPIVLPSGIGGVTYEAEIAAVIGRRAERVDPAAALDHVAGYAVFNDISASEMIKRDGSFERGKNLPTFGPFGPYLATADEVPDPQALRIGLDVDGEPLQDSSTRQMLFTVAELVSRLSHRTALVPGDVIATGTPAGAASARTPQTWLRPGTTVRAWVEGLGILSNPVIEGRPRHA